MTAARPAPRPRPRWRVARTVVLCVLLVIGFSVALFPWDRLRGLAQQALASATGAEVRLAEVGLGFGLGGPALRARDVTLGWPGQGAALTLSEARVRPAWSLSWARGEPAWHLDLRSEEVGRVAGTLWPAGPAFAGRTEGLDVAALPASWVGEGQPVAGRLDADLDLRASRDGLLRGHVELHARDGSLLIPETPVAIPYTEFHATLSRADDGATTLRELRLLGPMLSLEGEGTLGPGRDLTRAPLAVQLTITHLDPALAPLLQPIGLRVTPGVATGLEISGTLDRPVIRSR